MNLIFNFSISSFDLRGLRIACRARDQRSRIGRDVKWIMLCMFALTFMWIGFGQADGEYSHPMVSFFNVVFKVAAIAFYILSSFLIHSFVIQFVITIFLVALDFWTVKNVSGRLLVGLRWWNDINEEGESVWHFESLDQQSLEALSKKDSWLFWWSLYLSPVVWLGLGLIAIIKFNFDYLLVVAVALVFNIANIIGFTRCQKDAKKQIHDFAHDTVGSRVASSLSSAFSV